MEVQQKWSGSLPLASRVKIACTVEVSESEELSCIPVCATPAPDTGDWKELNCKWPTLKVKTYLIYNQSCCLFIEVACTEDAHTAIFAHTTNCLKWFDNIPPLHLT